MKTTSRIVRIGNSQGVRIPKRALEESGLSGEVEIESFENEVVIRSKRTIRDGWEDSYKEMARNADDAMLLGEQPPSEWDETEWQW